MKDFINNRVFFNLTCMDFDNSAVINFILNVETFTAIEDQCDDYRPIMTELLVSNVGL